MLKALITSAILSIFVGVSVPFALWRKTSLIILNHLPYLLAIPAVILLTASMSCLFLLGLSFGVCAIPLAWLLRLIYKKQVFENTIVNKLDILLSNLAKKYILSPSNSNKVYQDDKNTAQPLSLKQAIQSGNIQAVSLSLKHFSRNLMSKEDAWHSYHQAIYAPNHAVDILNLLYENESFKQFPLHEMASMSLSSIAKKESLLHAVVRSNAIATFQWFCNQTSGECLNALQCMDYQDNKPLDLAIANKNKEMILTLLNADMFSLEDKLRSFPCPDVKKNEVSDALTEAWLSLILKVEQKDLILASTPELDAKNNAFFAYAIEHHKHDFLVDFCEASQNKLPAFFEYCYKHGNLKSAQFFLNYTRKHLPDVFCILLGKHPANPLIQSLWQEIVIKKEPALNALIWRYLRSHDDSVFVRSLLEQSSCRWHYFTSHTVEGKTPLQWLISGNQEKIINVFKNKIESEHSYRLLKYFMPSHFRGSYTHPEKAWINKFEMAIEENDERFFHQLTDSDSQKLLTIIYHINYLGNNWLQNIIAKGADSMAMPFMNWLEKNNPLDWREFFLVHKNNAEQSAWHMVIAKGYVMLARHLSKVFANDTNVSNVTNKAGKTPLELMRHLPPYEPQDPDEDNDMPSIADMRLMIFNGQQLSDNPDDLSDMPKI